MQVPQRGRGGSVLGDISHLIGHSPEQPALAHLLEQRVGQNDLNRSVMFPADAWLCGPAPLFLPQLLLAIWPAGNSMHSFQQAVSGVVLFPVKPLGPPLIEQCQVRWMPHLS